MKVLVGCEFSGVVRRAFREAGHDAYSCDLRPSLDHSPYHIQGDVLDTLDRGWDLGIFHPTCTYLTNAGVHHFQETANHKRTSSALFGKARWEACVDACHFFNQLARAPIACIAIENPIQHEYARALVGPPQQIIQPWQFGHSETKAICLWLKFLPKLIPTVLMDVREPRVHWESPGKDRGIRRSIFYPRIAMAMAEQWGNL